MKTAPSPVALAAIGALLFFLSGFIQGGLRTSADPELVVGFSEAARALGWVAVIAAGISMGRRAA